jgi:hypothetical protein
MKPDSIDFAFLTILLNNEFNGVCPFDSTRLESETMVADSIDFPVK